MCKSGETQHGTQPIAFERDGAVVVVRNVPADICDQCGEAYVAGDVAATTLKLANESFGEAGVEVLVRHYAAA
jgi:YgiT-type zinc finger domain-containing protein